MCFKFNFIYLGCQKRISDSERHKKYIYIIDALSEKRPFSMYLYAVILKT